jgi:transglutaminase-like putative cysteine protease
MIYTYSKILNTYQNTQTLPNTIPVNSWNSISTQQVAAGSPPLPAGMAQYLQPTANCQSNNAQIIATAKSIISGATDPLTKAVKIFNWVRDNIGYSFYYNTKYGALGTLNAKTGNCCDTTHILIAFARAVGIPARYVHGTCQFSSGNWYGHVWADLYVNGAWYTADASSSRNSLGGINNWNTATFTLKGIYASLPF